MSKAKKSDKYGQWLPISYLVILGWIGVVVSTNLLEIVSNIFGFKMVTVGSSEFMTIFAVVLIPVIATSIVALIISTRQMKGFQRYLLVILGTVGMTLIAAFIIYILNILKAIAS